MDSHSIKITDEERDRIHILPLSMIPLEAHALRKTRMVKNSQLESVVELYKDGDTGSGQVGMNQLRSVFKDLGHKDITVLQKLSKMHSYDVYSLRRLLRDMEIEVEDQSGLELSDRKQDELAGYMKLFTRPLIMKLYGNDEGSGKTANDMNELFSHSDPKLVLNNLKLFAEMLKIKADEIPKVLSDYGDLYMSVSYYRDLLQSIGPIIGQFNASIDEISGNRQLQQNQSLVKNCVQVQNVFKGMAGDVLKRFKSFDQATTTMWNYDQPEAFGAFGRSIASSQVELGNSLCALTIKMQDWHQHFPNQNAGGPMKWADYIVNEMRQGLVMSKGLSLADRP